MPQTVRAPATPERTVRSAGPAFGGCNGQLDGTAVASRCTGSRSWTARNRRCARSLDQRTVGQEVPNVAVADAAISVRETARPRRASVNWGGVRGDRRIGKRALADGQFGAHGARPVRLVVGGVTTASTAEKRRDRGEESEMLRAHCLGRITIRRSPANAETKRYQSARRCTRGRVPHQSGRPRALNEPSRSEDRRSSGATTGYTGPWTIGDSGH